MDSGEDSACWDGDGLAGRITDLQAKRGRARISNASGLSAKGGVGDWGDGDIVAFG